MSNIKANFRTGSLKVNFSGSSISYPTIEESDGSPSVANVSKLVFSDATVTDNGDGSVTIDTSIPSTIEHNTLTGLQGGAANEYYHLTGSQHSEITTFFGSTDITGAQAETLTDGSNADSLHTHTASGVSDFSEAVDDRISNLIQDGTGISWTYNDSSNTLTGNVSLSPFSTTNLTEGTNLYYTDERSQDAIGSILSNEFDYNDSTPSISLDYANISHTNLQDIGANTHAQIDTALTRLANTSGTNTGDQDLSPYQLLSGKGQADGYASLDGSGTVPSAQLPSYVDDVLEYANFASFPVAGETGKIYIDLSTNKTYRWSGSAYVELADDTAIWGQISGTLSNQTDLQNALDSKFDTADFSSTFDSNLATKTTDNLTEGTNLYYTDERSQDAIGSILSNEFTYNDVAPSIALNYSNISHTSLQDIGTNTHAQIDTHIGDGTIHYNQASITITASQVSDFDVEVSNNTDVSANTSARHVAVTVTDSSEIDFTLTGQDITASLIAGSVDESKLDASVNASLDLADSSTQPGDNISTLTNDSGFLSSVDLTSDVTGILPVSNGGTGSANATNARTNLGVAIGSDVQAWDSHLDTIAGLTPASSLIIGDGLGDWTITTPANFITDNNILTTSNTKTISNKSISLTNNTITGTKAEFDTALSDGDFAYSGGAFHDGFSDFVANEHIDHTSITLTAGDGLSGGGDISANRNFSVNVDNSTIEIATDTLQIKANGINDTHIDFGTGANQVSAIDIPIADSGAIITATEVGGALQENRTAIDLNTTHRTSDGTDHAYIDQDVTIAASPTFGGETLTASSGDVWQKIWSTSGTKAGINFSERQNGRQRSGDSVSCLRLR